MRIVNKIFIFWLVLLIGAGLGQTAFAAKTLSLSKDVSITNIGDAAARTAILDITLDGAHDVNGLVFTLTYNPAVFTFDGLLKGDMEIDDGSTYDAKNPPLSATIASTLYYQVNNKADKGIVLIAAAAANFFTTSSTEVFTAFKAKFQAKEGMGSGNYTIGIQKTIIGPETAANAGYSVPTLLAVAAGLAPDADPRTAQSFDVAFSSGSVRISGGGYKVSGPAVYGSTPVENISSGVANLLKVSAAGDSKISSQAIKDGAYAFSGVSNGTYKVEIVSTRPGFQKQYISSAFDVAGADYSMAKITLAKYAAKSGNLTINGTNTDLSGLRVVVKDGSGNVIANVAVDDTGNYVTPPLPASGYTIWAVYGASEVEITSSLSFNWVLSLGSVSGTITGLCDGQDVEVMIRSENDARMQKSVLVTGDGSGTNTYALNNLLPGIDYILSVFGDGVAAFYNGTENFSDATAVAVTADTDTSGKDFAFTCADIRSISGQLTIDGTPQANVTVKANNFNFENWKFGSAVTDANGDFKIQVATADDYYVYIEQNNLKYYHKTGASAVTSRADATPVDVSAASVPDIDVSVVIPTANTAGLEGYVTLSEADGEPLANYLVVLLTAENVPTAFFSRTDQNGYYAFTNVPPGTYNISLKPPAPYSEQINEGVVLVNGTTARSDFIVNQHYTVTGAVKDIADGTTPVATARVDILKSNGAKLRAPAFTNASGEYSLHEIPSGVYTLAASHKEYYPAQKDDVTILSNLIADDILMTKGAIISGTVTDSGGVVASATVTLAGPGYVKSTKTNAAGQYQFGGLAANSAHMIKAAKGTEYLPYDPDDVTTGNIGSTVTRTLNLLIPSTVWNFGGTVTEGGSAVSGAYVMLYSPTTEYRKVVQTSASGAFLFDRVINGTDYALLVLPGNGKPEIYETGISITADILNHAVVVPAFATISGTITLSEVDADAIVIAGAYDPAAKIVHEVQAQNPGADNQTFTYAIKVKTGVSYKVFAQDLAGTFSIQYFGGDGTYGNATGVTGDTANVDISLTR